LTIWPDSSAAVRSVNVPPVSMLRRYMTKAIDFCYDIVRAYIV
jgi:hypothetical protein